jgi:undecaprenyl-diphosphatase
MNFINQFTFLQNRKKAYYLLITLVVIFLILTAIVLLLPTTGFDLRFTERIQKVSNPALDVFMKSISWFGVTSVALAIVLGIALIFVIIHRWREAFFTMATFLAPVITYGIKILINRPRPTEELVKIVEKAQHQSFPSGHTSFYVVFFGFMIFLLVRNGFFKRWFRYSLVVILLIIIFSIPFSRIYLGAHWFTDVAAGFVLGILVLWALIEGYLYKPKSASGINP